MKTNSLNSSTKRCQNSARPSSTTRGGFDVYREPSDMFKTDGQPPQAEKHELEPVVQLHSSDTSLSIPEKPSAWAKNLQVQAGLQRLDRLGFEAIGIERVPTHQRTQTSLLDCFTFWMAANCNISTFTLGTLGSSLYGLNLRDAVLTIIFFNLLSTVPVAYSSNFGARSGLRQIVFSRFAFGYRFCMLIAALNVIATIGWTVINTIVGAQLLRSVSNSHPLPLWLGVIILSLLALVPAFAGYRYIHTYERYAWLAPAAIFIVLLGESRRYMSDGNEVGSSFSDSDGYNQDKAAKVLSFGASVVGFGLAWISFAADYTVSLPQDTPAWRIFIASYLGLNIPLILVQSLGAAMMTTVSHQVDWALAHANHGPGGLIQAGLSPLGRFGTFLTVIMGLSVVGNNIPNGYSLGLSIQVFGRRFQAIPRSLITLVGTALSIGLSIIGASRFDSWLESALGILSYWLAIYAAILLEYHLIFQKRSWSNYIWVNVNHASRLPLGVGAVLSACIGVTGALLGISQTWFTGPVGKRIGSGRGADIGFELAFVFTALSYPGLYFIERRLEIKVTKKAVSSDILI